MLELVQKSLAELERTKGKKIISQCDSQRDSQRDRSVKENGRKEGSELLIGGNSESIYVC